MRKLLALSSFAAIVLSACTAGSGDGETIKLGYIGPLTGDAASYGADTVNGTKMAVDEINAAGGIGGREVILVVEDGKCTGSDAATAAQKLVNVDKVVAIIGGQCSGETLAAAPISGAAEVVTISPISSSPHVTDAGDFVFRDYPSDALKTKAMAKVFNEKGYVRVALLSENTDYATALRDSLVEAVGSDDVVFNETTEPGTKDFRTVLSRLKNMEFDVFVPNGQSDAFIAAAMQQYREAGFTEPAFSQDVADSANLGRIAGDAVEGMQLINTSSTLGEGGPDSFAVQFRAKYGEPQSNLSFATLAYDATHLLAQAIEAVGTEGGAIRDYLYGVTYTGAAGTFSFDSNGDVVGIGYALKEFRNGIPVEIGTVAAE